MEYLKRKNRENLPVSIVPENGLQGLFDDLFKTTFRLTEQEYVFLYKNASFKEIQVLTDLVSFPDPSFALRRQCIFVLNKYMVMYEKGEKTWRAWWIMDKLISLWIRVKPY